MRLVMRKHLDTGVHTTTPHYHAVSNTQTTMVDRCGQESLNKQYIDNFNYF